MNPTPAAESEATARPSLNREKIIAAAIDLADRDGVAALTMRKLAKELGYEVMSLYNHVANKRELLATMVDTAAADIAEPADGVEPLESIRAIAVSMRAVFVDHPWAPEIWLQHLPGPARKRCMEDLLRLFSQSGLSPDLAHHGFHAVNNHVVGHTLQDIGMTLGQDDLADSDATIQSFLAGLSTEAHPHTIAHVHQHIDGESASSFELVLDLILDGLVRLDNDHPTD